MDKERLLDSQFEFNARLSDCKDVDGLSVPMSPADELFCNGRIRPMKPSAVPQKTLSANSEHRSKAQSSLISKEGHDIEEKHRGRQYLWRKKHQNRHRGPARSLSPQRNSSSQWEGKGKGQKNSEEEEGVEGIKVAGVASPLTFTKPRGSRKSWSLRDIFLPRSKSEGREQERDERRLSFSGDTKLSSSDNEIKRAPAQGKSTQKKKTVDANRKGVPVSAQDQLQYISCPIRRGVPPSPQELHYIPSPNRKGVPVSARELHYIPSPDRRRVPVSAHELHYTANRAQAEELRRKTFLPYRQSVLGCLGFPSPSALPQGHVLQPLY